MVDINAMRKRLDELKALLVRAEAKGGSTKEYKTTWGNQAGLRDEDCSDPEPPEDDGRGEWRFVGATADEKRLYWFWEREASDGSK